MVRKMLSLLQPDRGYHRGPSGSLGPVVTTANSYDSTDSNCFRGNINSRER